MTGNTGGNVLLTMAGYFASLSLFAFGGANAAIPDMQRISVDVMHWMTAKEFADIFAIAQMSPGPNVIIVALIGYHVAGLPAPASPPSRCADRRACSPSSCRASGTASRRRAGGSRFRTDSIPVALGLIAASAIVIARTADHGLVAVAITMVTAIVAFATRLNPMWLFAAGGVIGLSGLV